MEAHKYGFRQYYHVLYALILHDIKNRFFGSGVGQIVMILWPFVHIIVLLLIYSFSGRGHPYGTSLLQYSAVSVFPFICFNYVCRWIVLSAITNKSFLQYPVIRPLDIVVARSALEIVSISIVGVLLFILVIIFGADPMPDDPAQAVCAICATLLLAISFGIPNAVIAFIIPIWNVVTTMIIIVAYVASGILYVPSTMPETIRVALSYNPLLQCTEWLRAAYYFDYPTLTLDKLYIFEVSLVSMTVGLIMMRLFSRFF